MFGGDFGITSSNALVHPLLERVTNDCVHHIGNVLPGQLVDLFWRLRQRFKRLSLVGVGSEAEDIFNGQSNEERNIDVLDLCTLDDAALVGHQVSQVKNGHGVVRC